MPLPDLTTYQRDEAAAMKAYGVSAADNAAISSFLPQVQAKQSPVYEGLVAQAKVVAGLSSVLDVGCAAGEQYARFKAEFPSLAAYTGVDIFQAYLDRCIALYPTGTWTKVAQYYSLPFANKSFDLVTIRAALNYYFPTHGLQILTECRRVAKKALAVVVYQWPVTGQVAAVASTCKNGNTRGYHVRWPKSSWDSFLAGKTYSVVMLTSETRLLVIR